MVSTKLYLPAFVVEKNQGAAKEVGEKTWKSNTLVFFPVFFLQKIIISVTYDILISVQVLEPPAKGVFVPIQGAVQEVCKIRSRSEDVFSNLHRCQGDHGGDDDVDRDKEERPELFSALVHLRGFIWSESCAP